MHNVPCGDSRLQLQQCVFQMRRRGMITSRLGAAFLAIVVLSTLTSEAQTAGNGSQGQEQTQGWEHGGYVVHQSVEVGYRESDVTGSEQMYNTLVNLHSGPRFLEQSLSMQSETHTGMLFDNLFINSFGWGGD